MREESYKVQQYSSTTMDFHFLGLPREIQAITLQFCEAIELLRLAVTCKDLYLLCQQDYLWKEICKSLWTDLEASPATSWRRYFYERVTFLTKNTMEWKKDMALNQLPSARQSLTGNYVKGKVIYIGGQTSVTLRFDEIYYYDPDKKVFSKPPKVYGSGPPKFARHAAVEIGNKIYVFGGFDGFGAFFGLGVFDVDTCHWSYPEVHGAPPVPRTNHAIAAVGNRIYLFGGNDTTKPLQDSNLQFGTYGDFQVFDIDTMTWSELHCTGKIPCPRSGHHMITIGSKLFLFGGGLWNDKSKTWIEKYNDMFIFETETSEWFAIPQVNPNINAFISLPHWKVGNFIFVYLDPLWCFDAVTYTWHVLKVKGAKPNKRFLGPATAVPNRNSAYLFGGVYTQVMNCFDQLQWPSSITEVLRLRGAQDLEEESKRNIVMSIS